MTDMDETLNRILQLDGAVGACIVDSNTGLILGSQGGGSVDLDVAAAGNTAAMRAQRQTVAALELDETIEDMLVSMGRLYHLIRPVSGNDALFIYLVIEKEAGNLAMSRLELARLEKELRV